MPVSSVIVETTEGTHETVLKGLAKMSEATVYGVKGNQIVVVLEGDGLGPIEESIRTIHAIEGVTGVFPVFSAEDE